MSLFHLVYIAAEGLLGLGEFLKLIVRLVEQTSQLNYFVRDRFGSVWSILFCAKNQFNEVLQWSANTPVLYTNTP
jgi:hypothetical protein